ncbi:hypothetical protein EDD70_1086 [Hydrogenoanaerobacterium saccharovorans]|uniref:DUF6273 domain-containing protein n=1 Tax=Hydrogenoanaerobacterium saccharovorans TaxID=474960 RepID=A0A1H7ZYH5_9FIRM|nr:DUF6273 domain-containing protein [Hydrogenoanaerobacterium saccharovorans]RPF48271.1 hypothetical protein EDD70_1086 [Hydrogenoanaerobacterium saccharovorans]SEM63712.1 hypothetical protein SAMN05216180_1005 [Hydrogenoanaerobacterium saccharovorans]
MAKELSALSVGALVKDIGTLYNGKPIVWRIVDKNHSGYPTGAITLMTDKIISLKCFDAREVNNSDSNRSERGNNRYIYSNIRQWLNSDANAGSWYAAQHDADAPPNDEYTEYKNAYVAEAGFLKNLSDNMVTSLLATTINVGKTNVDGGGTETCTDKIFLASRDEMGLSGDHAFSVFKSKSERQAYPTAECVSKSEYTDSNFNTSSPWYYWLRDPDALSSHMEHAVGYTGTSHGTSVCFSHWGVRPLCNLPSQILVSDSPEDDGAYAIVWNLPPSTPPNIDVPSTVCSEKSLTISWGSSIDEDSNLAGYTLERQCNGGAWVQLYKGINRAFTDSITFGWNTVAYRVKAYDSVGAESAYQTSGTRTVINNTAPTISGNDEDLGLKTGAFSVSYTATDADSGQTITAVEKIDGAEKRKFTATNGQNYSFNVTAKEWIKLLNGTHTITITVSDNYGGTTTRTYTFTKNETEIELTLATPLPADDLVTKAIMSVTRQIPLGATFSVEVCNNGNDASPTWEDVTNAVLRNSKFFLTNTIKTAATWGFNFRIKVNRNNAKGDCFIVSAGGNFE